MHCVPNNNPLGNQKGWQRTAATLHHIVIKVVRYVGYDVGIPLLLTFPTAATEWLRWHMTWNAFQACWPGQKVHTHLFPASF
jgi:hypothetical protein